MKYKNIVAIIALFGIGAAILWWLKRPAMESPILAKSADSPGPIIPSKSVSLLTVEAPKAAPAPPSIPGQEPEDSPSDPRVVKLNTTIDEIESALKSGDINYFLEIVSTPEELAKTQADAGGVAENAQEFEQRPDFAEFMDLYLKALPQLKNNSPVFNDTGDEAIYTLNDAPSHRTVIQFKKIAGRWYIDH